MRYVDMKRKRVVRALGMLMLAAVVVSGCGGEGGFGSECARGECPSMRAITDDLADRVEVEWTGESDAEIVLPAPREQVIFGGTMLNESPPPTFTFEGEPGQWVAITVYSRGMAWPTFRVGEGHGYTRWSLTNREEYGVARRVMLLPREGTYSLRVYSGVKSDVAADRLTSGGEDAHFVGVIETLAPPAPRALPVDGPVREERFLNVQRSLYQLEEGQGGPVGLQVEAFHDDGHPYFALTMTLGDIAPLASSDLRIRSIPIRRNPVLRRVVNLEEEPQVHVDLNNHTNNYGWYRVSARALEAMAPEAQLRAEEEGAPGQIMVAYHRNWAGAPAQLEIRKGGTPVITDDDVPGVGEQSYTKGAVEYALYLEEGDSVEARLTPAAGTPLYEAEVHVEVKEPLAIWEAYPGAQGVQIEYKERLGARRSEYVLLNVREPTGVTISASGAGGELEYASAADVDVYLYDIDDPSAPLRSKQGFGGERFWSRLEAGRYLVQFEGYSRLELGMWLSAEYDPPR
ncbi:hypothetical protein DL240_17140 [Lujinxingia litoralis]|uniref:Peptidase C-terminal archaeal/bacterial domain-containing protein n=1 Tax=Lujinxingia litoralis TaxID=2211119 RepID=A0A328C3N1_9DELT|nr:hypothetical protein [Lujinxingia litoralis]RAL20525.1 hypothetical protein DL240_17140 [Lujinxingia litoralis]